MHWTYKPLPQLILRAIHLLICLNTGINLWWVITGSNTSSVLRNYSSSALVLFFLALVTVVEKPTKGLTGFVIICDSLILIGLIMCLWVERSFLVLPVFIALPVIALLIVLSRPKTAHYMVGKYYEAVQQAENENIA
jgi:fumarate reductase subunit C